MSSRSGRISEKDREAANHAVAEALTLIVEVLAFVIDFYAAEARRARKPR